MYVLTVVVIIMKMMITIIIIVIIIIIIFIIRVYLFIPYACLSYHRPTKGDPKRGGPTKQQLDNHFEVTFKSLESGLSSRSPFLDPPLGDGDPGNSLNTHTV